MKKYILFTILTLGLSLHSFNQESFFNSTIEEIDRLQKDQERPVLIFFTAGWCKYCQAMKSDVFTDSSIVQLARDFYTVEFYEGIRNTFRFKKQEFQFIPTGIDQGYHEFTDQYATTNGNINFPTLVVLWKGKIIFKASQFLPKEDLESVMTGVLEKIK